jgi:hypothetical protein
MTIASLLRTTGFAALLLSPNLLAAQEQITPPSRTREVGAPVGHRQPRAADIPSGLMSNKSAAELLEERQSAELNRKLRICRGC